MTIQKKQVDEMTIQWNSKSTKCQHYKKIIWLNGKLSIRQVDKTLQFDKCWVDEITSQ
jgi:hypothetical protein